MDDRQKILEALNRWKEQTYYPRIAGYPEFKREILTGSGAASVKSLYTPLDLDRINYLESIGFPGEYPCTRGIDPLMYRGALWTIGEYAGFGTAEDSNQRYKYLIEHGQTGGINIALDLPTQLGYDSDDELAEGEVGRVGVALDTLRDVEILFAGLPLNRVGRVFTTANAISPIMLSWLMALAEKQGVPLDSFVVNIQNDILKEFVARGTYIFPIRPSVGVATDVIEFCATRYPMWRSITVCGSHMRQAGADAVQEIAFALANAKAYILEAMKRGVEIDYLAPTITLQLVAHNDFFEEISKLRAVRKLWAVLLKETFHARNPESYRLRLLVFTAGSTLTAQQPLNNIVRVAVQALAAALGGAQVIYTASYDEALATPTEEAVRIAMRTQQILGEESNIAAVIDPLGGSYYVEWLTNELFEKAMNYIAEIDGKGGAITAIEEGHYQKYIAEGAYRQQREIESGKRVVVGVNKYQLDSEEREIGILEVNPIVEEKQKRNLQGVRKTRDNTEVKRRLRALESSARKGQSLIIPVYEAVRSYASVGEICSVLRDVFGEHTASFRL